MNAVVWGSGPSSYNSDVFVSVMRQTVPGCYTQLLSRRLVQAALWLFPRREAALIPLPPHAKSSFPSYVRSIFHTASLPRTAVYLRVTAVHSAQRLHTPSSSERVVVTAAANTPKPGKLFTFVPYYICSRESLTHSARCPALGSRHK